MTINNISAEKWHELVVYREECLRLGREVFQTDRNALTETYKNLVNLVFQKPIEVIWTEGPKTAYKLFKDNGIKTANLHETCIFSWYSYWGQYLQFLCSIPNISFDQKKYKLLTTFNETAKGCMFWYCEDTIVAVDRPTVLEVNNAGRLHNPNGPAIAWADGTAFYFVEGVSVKKEYIENPLSLTLKIIQAERNAETRRALISVYGLKRYLKDVKAKLLDSTSLEKLFEGPNGEKFLLCVDGSTGRTPYELTLPPETATIQEAQAALYGLPFKNLLKRS